MGSDFIIQILYSGIEEDIVDLGKNAECTTVDEAIARAFAMAGEIRRKDRSARPMIYVGGSTYVVSEAIAPVRRLTL